MPVGELLALASGLTFGLTSINEKLLTVRVKPLTLGAIASLGGGLFDLLFSLVLGKVDDLAQAPIGYLLLGIAGGMLSVGLGYTLFMWFLRSVDINKASPLSHGFSSLLSVLSGVLVLSESPPPLALIGVVFIIGGSYVLSFGQRKSATPSQAAWLGMRGMALLIGITTLWTVGFTLQAIAVREVDPLLINMTRLIAVSLFLSILVFLGVNDLLVKGAVQREDPPVAGGVDRYRGEVYTDAPAFTDPDRGPDAAPRGLAGYWVQPGKTLLKRGGWTPLLALGNGGVSFGIGSLLSLMAIQRIGYAIASILGGTQLLYVTLLSALILRESLKPKTVAGIVAIFAGIAFILV